ncbi:MAG: DUF4168 domain-containing protein [Gemmatimonadaceae bacterium]|nr:DUF4168 domain-containing protein [Gemmatimonadaceae bacterium]
MVRLQPSVSLLCAALLSASVASAQQTTPPRTPSAPATSAAVPLSTAELRALAEAQIAIAAVLDSSGAQLAQVKNKTVDAQKEMQQRRQTAVTAALAKRGLTVKEFERRRFLVSTDSRMRFQLDSMVAGLTGQPIPGRVVVSAAPAATAPVTMPVLALSYVGTRYLDTPENASLVGIGTTEAKIAAQHAGFMMRSPENLQALQMHAGHVLHAIDPLTMPAAKAPGKGYGLKRALATIVEFAEFAGQHASATPKDKQRAADVVAAAQSTAKRADAVIALAKRIQSASSAADASKLAGELQSLCEELVAGSDVNHDGRIVAGNGEGGLQQVTAALTAG